jgi:zinc transporter
MDTSFGSDQHGLVWGFHFALGEPPQSVGCVVVPELLKDGGGGFVWLHFSSSNAAAERFLLQRGG